MTQPADLLITNAAVYTVDDANPWAQAVAVRGNRIVFVGRADEAGDWRGPRTQVIDGAGRTLLPGLIDSHFHLLWGSLKLADLQLWEAEDLDEVATLMAVTVPHGMAVELLEQMMGIEISEQGARADRGLTDLSAPQS